MTQILNLLYFLTQYNFSNRKWTLVLFLANFQLFLTRVVQTSCANDIGNAGTSSEQQGLMGNLQGALHDVNTAELL